MLKHLEIDNYALIDHLEIGFSPGFSAITGETGAGKSIIIGALGLILGNRADSQVLFDKGRKCYVEGLFEINGYGMQHFFDENQLDYDDLAILRREIIPNGKSRAFINDTPVGLNQLKDLAAQLVDIHSQHTTITLNSADFQLAVIDSFAGITDLANRFRKNYLAFNNDEKKLSGFTDDLNKARSDQDYFLFLHNELDSARLIENEQEELEEQVNILSHAEEIRNNLYKAAALLTNDETNIIDSLGEAEDMIRKAGEYYPALEPVLERLTSNLIDLKDIANEISRMEQQVDYNPEQLAATQERLDLVYRLEQKHRVNSVKELIAVREKLGNDLVDIASLEEQIGRLKISVSEQLKALGEGAETLSQRRKSVFSQFEEQITRLLQHMGMPDARFAIEHELLSELTSDGNDKVDFLFNANKGHSLKALSDVASGGELSRLMLGIKSMISQKNLLPTIIFDEIDNGISGDIAGRVGDVLLKTSGQMQVVTITHLPQIAGKAHYQYAVYKETADNATFSNIKRLNPQERVEELAIMIGGREISTAALQTAREMLG